jgi:hypothetical protein
VGPTALLCFSCCDVGLISLCTSFISIIKRATAKVPKTPNSLLIWLIGWNCHAQSLSAAKLHYRGSQISRPDFAPPASRCSNKSSILIISAASSWHITPMIRLKQSFNVCCAEPARQRWPVCRLAKRSTACRSSARYCKCRPQICADSFTSRIRTGVRMPATHLQNICEIAFDRSLPPIQHCGKACSN